MALSIHYIATWTLWGNVYEVVKCLYQDPPRNLGPSPTQQWVPRRTSVGRGNPYALGQKRASCAYTNIFCMMPEPYRKTLYLPGAPILRNACPLRLRKVYTTAARTRGGFQPPPLIFENLVIGAERPRYWGAALCAASANVKCYKSFLTTLDPKPRDVVETPLQRGKLECKH